MCPPVVVYPNREGMSYLYTSWLYELQHGLQLLTCFICFKDAFLNFKAILQSEDLEDEHGELDGEEELSEEEWSSESEPGTGPQPGPPMASTQQISLDLCPKNEDWTQALPWKIQGLLHCTHWPRPSSPRQVSPCATMAPVEPMVLQLGTMGPVEPREAQAWLLGLQIFLVVGYEGNTVLMRKMAPLQALRSPGQSWRVLLEPSFQEWRSTLYEPTLLPYLFQYPLGILERTQLSYRMFPAFTVLQKKGFIILSISPWSAREGGEGYSASAP
ncbi:PREDICTED: testis-expressed protein 19.2-like [Chinchilla lanigera]|uniref:testis-expressed protein 19.2-like n=1 Tax=Chinchilla lanigera TaxID=34839 RepID=UPI000697D8AE|nr:PREDICTED: testis-expressed protein 19.2-like [Chinchilla lanigera]XP_013361418.1 PREDICTED: testis-expressed protein 19.2-like [Chinchilla lanigera]XP_013361419.1 PREDICTED: testis-expressed protein 19.2-like [Chinchilla lanigera]